jgi:sarcosine/dimethylglycine N-methyltransferase
VNPQAQRRRILDQYSTPAARSLYRHVMGDGGDHIHYGLYADGGTPMPEALAASSRRLLDMALSRIDRASLKEILDLGAGAGGPAKCLLSWTGAGITCVDLGEPALRDLERWAAAAEMSSRLRTWNGSFSGLPPAWTGGFDLAWSQDALCHAADRAAVFSEARRVLRPGGALVFSDILLAEDAPQEHARAFTAVNAVQNLGTAQAYSRDLRHAGFTDIRVEDWSSHLPTNFLRMRRQIDIRRRPMLEEGVSAETLDRFAEALEVRLRWPVGAVLQWRAYLCVAG